VERQPPKRLIGFQKVGLLTDPWVRLCASGQIRA
jgi:hypothetical protein